MKKIVALSSFILLPFLSANAFAIEEKFEAVDVLVPPGANEAQVVELATKVRPSYRQLDYQKREMVGFIHFGMNTFTGAEWGTGKEDISQFSPTNLDADKWIKTFKDAGITAVILVAKHHDGFCAWPTKTTKHNISNTPWRNGKGDLVRDVSEACKKYGIKLCIYLSPWDMNAASYGTEAYNDLYIAQLEELLKNYGPVYLLWFDGAGTDSATSGKKMSFAWERIFKRARELQPDVLLSGNAPDIRWVGNEKGKGRETEWCVQGVFNEEKYFGQLKNYSARLPKLGGREDISKKRRLIWYPSRGGLPLRKGWFYNARDDNSTKSLSYLVDSYFSTVGQNSNLLPNLSPDKTGQIPEKDAKRLIDFGKIIMKMKSVDYAKGAKVVPISGWHGKTDSALITDETPFSSWNTRDGVTHASAEITLEKPAEINVIKLQENVRDFGQRVERFEVDAEINGEWEKVAASTTIGYRKMIRLKQLITSAKFRVRFLESRVSISWGGFSLYRLPDFTDASGEINAQKTIPEKEVFIQFDGLSAAITSLHCKGEIWTMEIKKERPAFIFMLRELQAVSGLIYTPLESDEAQHIENYAVYLSDDWQNWGKPVASGRFGNIVNNPVPQTITFPPQKAKYIKFEILKTTSDSKILSTAGFEILKP